MFIAKFFDQKQGEARVVDHREVLRDKLGQWLETRPTTDELASRGLLGRGTRLAVARGVVDGFLRSRFRAQEEERARIPPGHFVFSKRVCSLLDGVSCDAHSLETKLRELRTERAGLQKRLDEVGAEWAHAADECERAVGFEGIPAIADCAERAVERLEELHKHTGGSLADVFAELGAYRRVVVQRRCLDDIVQMMEKTDCLREAVFAFGNVESLPLSNLDETLELCTRLPSHSRSVGIKRVQFLLRPIRTALTQELQRALASTGRWPLPGGQGKLEDLVAQDAAGNRPNSQAIGRVERLCLELGRTQRAEEVTKTFAVDANPGTSFVKLLGNSAESKSGSPEDYGLSWASEALAEPLVARFRYHFCRPESDLCRMDKPEWAFQFLSDMASQHLAELKQWFSIGVGKDDASCNARIQGQNALGIATQTSGEEEPLALMSEETYARCSSNFSDGLAVALACEARFFVRSRMPLLADSPARPALLHTVQHLVRFHTTISEMGGRKAGVAVFADFDANRPLPASSLGEQDAMEGVFAPQGAKSSRIGGRLLKGLSHLHKVSAGQSQEAPIRPAQPSGGAVGDLLAGFEQGLERSADTVTQGVDVDGALRPQVAENSSSGTVVGFLDVWVGADRNSVSEKLAAAVCDGGIGWKPRHLAGLAQVTRFDDEASGPEAMELGVLVADIFEKARERVECLSTEGARKKYVGQVLDTALRQALAAIRRRWRGLEDILDADSQEAARVVETLEELCRFADRFPLAVHMVGAVDEANALRISTLERLAEFFLESVYQIAGRLHEDSCMFSFALAAPVESLRRRLRPTNFQVVMQRAVTKIGEFLTTSLLRQPAFSSDAQAELYVANCRDDLALVLCQVAALDASATTPVQPLWDGCALLSLQRSDAADAFNVLRKIQKCAPSSGVKRPWREVAIEVAEAADQSASRGELLQRKLALVLDPAGVRELGVDESLAVLSKRHELAKDAQEILVAGAGALQEIIGSSAQEALQFGSVALTQLSSGAKAQLASRSAIRQTATAGVAELRNLLPGRLSVLRPGLAAISARNPQASA